MSNNSLTNLRNTYPGDSTNVTGSYENNNGAIRYTGKYPENFIEFQTLSLDDINVASIESDTNITFELIVQFMYPDGSSDYWTSDLFLQKLHQAYQDSNPFFSRDRVTVAQLNYKQLENYCNSEKFILGEKYAEVAITKTIGKHQNITNTETDSVKREILKHLNWLLGSDDTIRNTQGNGNSNSDSFGDWELYTSEFISGSLAGDLGFPIKFKENDIPKIKKTPTPEANIIGHAPVVLVDTTPFTTRGNIIGEIRRLRNGASVDSYKWTSNGWTLLKN